MTFKPPLDFSEMMKMFDPERITKLFDPEQMKRAFEPPKARGFDLQAMIESNRSNFEAMLAANKSAAAGYKDFYQKQMAIFDELMKSAKEHIESLDTAPDLGAAQKHAEIYRVAVEKALAIMTELATAAQKANEGAFSIIKDRVKESVAELKRM